MSTDFDAEIQTMLDDCQTTFGVTITLTPAPAPGIDPTTGLQNSPASGVTCTAIRGPRKGVDISMGGGMTQVSEVEYRVKDTALSFTPRVGAIVTDGAATLRVCSVVQDANDLAWVLTCRSN